MEIDTKIEISSETLHSTHIRWHKILAIVVHAQLKSLK